MTNPYAPPGQGSRADDARAGEPRGAVPETGPRDEARDAPRSPRPRPAQDSPTRQPQDRPGPGTGPGPGPVHPAGPNQQPRRVDPDAVARASLLTRHFALLMLAGLLTLGMPLPWSVAALAFTVAALVVGTRALLAARRAGVRGGLVVSLSLGLAVSALVTLSFTSVFALWPVQLERQACVDRALTISATRVCEREFEQAVTERLEQLLTPGQG